MVCLLAGAASLLAAAGATAVAAPHQPPATINWQPCHQFSDETIKWMVPPDQFDEFKALWARTECGTVKSPMDYRKPNGRQITVAVTRLKATDQAHRLGSLALNPGGPGGSGYLLPVRMVMAHQNGNGEKLNQRYDLIGFDPRGVGYSTKVNCADPGAPPVAGQPSPLTEELARKFYDWQVAANKQCAAVDPAFLGQLTTQNVARDLDLIRRGLHERKLNYLGVSWGTWLGAVYRSMYPKNVREMWLDSPAPPWTRLDDFENGRAKATAEDFAQMAAWLADRDGTYHLGSTAAQVEDLAAAMVADFDAHHRTYSDLPGVVIDGNFISQIVSQFSLSWPLGGPLLKALHDTPNGAPAPPELKQIFGPPPGGDQPTPPADLPEDMNPTMGNAVFCNGDNGKRDFASAWAAYQKRLKDYPATGETSLPIPNCAGWTLPVQPVHLKHSNGSLVMSAHKYETVSPYVWTKELKAAIGGSILTVDDDVHGSVMAAPNDCAPRIAAYFASGKPDNGECQGIPVPTDDGAPPAATAKAATTTSGIAALRQALTRSRSPWAAPTKVSPSTWLVTSH
jgi:pimeloyl-ACP methyl ester carboxylesterase